MSQEIFGKWLREVDEKWRLVVPASIRRTMGQRISLKLNAVDCIEIKKFSPRTKVDSSIFIRKMERGRITIPPLLRNSTSFYFGKRVMLILQNDHCEVWPWP